MTEILKKVHFIILCLTITLLPFLYENQFLIVMTVLIFSFIIVRKQYKDVTPSIKKSGVLLVLLLIFLTYATVFSVSIVDSFYGYMNYIYAILLMIIIQATLEDKKDIMLFTQIFVIVSTVVSSYGIVQYLSGEATTGIWVDQGLHPEIEIRITSLMQNPNNFGEYIVLIFPFTIALLLYKKKIMHKLIALGLAGILSICMVITYSRSSYLGFVAAFVVLVLLCEIRLLYGGIAVAIPLIVWMPASLQSRINSLVESIMTFFENSSEIADTSVSWRVMIWQGAARTLQEFYVFGAGLSNDVFKLVYPFYRITNAKGVGVVGDHAHNLYLELLIELGIFGFLIMFGFLLSVLFSGLKVLFTTDSRMIKYFSGAAIAGIVGLLVTSLAEYTWYYHKVFFAFFVLLGILMALYNNEAYNRERKKIEAKNENDVLYESVEASVEL